MSIFCKPIVSTNRWVLRFFLEAVGLVGLLSRSANYRGLFDFCRVIGGLLNNSHALIQIHPKVTLNIAFSDPYWLAYIPIGRTYEPEVERVIAAFSDESITFIDAGANLGYWAILGSRNERWTVYAVEAAQRTFERLCQSISLNDAKLTPLHNAVSDESNKEVMIAVSEAFHAGTHVVGSGALLRTGKDRLERIGTVSIDDLVNRYSVKFPIIVKLDVEGQELPALKGATKALQGDALVIYEEHGSRRDCAATKFLLQEGFFVHFLSLNEIVPIKSERDALAYMKRDTVGYNFAASKSLWMNRQLCGL